MSVSPVELHIREAVAGDAAQVVAILNPIIEAGAYTAFDTPLTIEEEREFISAFPAGGIFHVAISATDGRVLGLQNVEPFANYTHAFDHVGVMGTWIDLAYRRQGIGQQLFEATLARTRQQGYEKIVAYVRADNEAALAAYASQGFRVAGTLQRHAKIHGRYVDEVIMERFL